MVMAVLHLLLQLPRINSTECPYESQLAATEEMKNKMGMFSISFCHFLSLFHCSLQHELHTATTTRRDRLKTTLPPPPPPPPPYNHHITSYRAWSSAACPYGMGFAETRPATCKRIPMHDRRTMAAANAPGFESEQTCQQQQTAWGE